MKKIRLDKFIADCGIAARSQAKKLIKSRRVHINGVPVTDEGFKVDEDAEDITVDGKALRLKKYIYIMLNKPAGVISATEDKMHRTVTDLLGNAFAGRELFPAGRLDIDTEGLIILTNDGVFAHNTLSPRKHVKKTYFVRVSGYRFSEESRRRFESGIEIDGGYICKSAEITLSAQTDEYAELNITISEGKFHQIKRMFAADGGKVIYLKRLSFGEITLDPALSPGEWRELNAAECEYVNRVKG